MNTMETKSESHDKDTVKQTRYMLNKEKYHEKIFCDACNCYYKKYNKTSHLRAAKHQNAIKLKEENEKLSLKLKENNDILVNKIKNAILNTE
jgi:hypothetical protein